MEAFLIRLSPRTWASLWIATQDAQLGQAMSPRGSQPWAGSLVTASCLQELILITCWEQPANKPEVLFQDLIEAVKHSFTFPYCLNSSSRSDDNMFIITTQSNWGKENTALGHTCIHRNVESPLQIDASVSSARKLPSFLYIALQLPPGCSDRC